MADVTLKPDDASPRETSRLWDELQQPRVAYGVAFVLLAAAFIVRALLAPTLGEQALYLFLVPAVLVAGIVGGWGPGLLTTALAIIFHLYLSGEFSNLSRPNSPLFAAEVSRAATFALV